MSNLQPTAIPTITMDKSQSSAPAVSSDKGIKTDSGSPMAAPSTASTSSISGSSDKPQDTSVSSSNTPSTNDIKPKDALQDRLAPKFAALTKKERQVVQAQQALKAEELRIKDLRSKQDVELQSLKSKAEQEIADLRKSAEYQEFESWKQYKKSSPLEAMEKLGYTYDQITQQLLNDKKPTPEHQLEVTRSDLEAKIKKLEDQRLAEKAEIEINKKLEAEAKQKEIEEQKQKLTQEQSKQLSKFQDDILEYVSKNSNDIELSMLYNNNDPKAVRDLVYATIEQHFETTAKNGSPGVVLNFAEATNAIETYYEQLASKSSATKRMKAKVSPSEPAEPAPASKTDNANPQSEGFVKSPNTLNNNMTASSVNAKALTDAERFQRAMSALSR